MLTQVFITIFRTEKFFEILTLELEFIVFLIQKLP